MPKLQISAFPEKKKQEPAAPPQAAQDSRAIPTQPGADMDMESGSKPKGKVTSKVVSRKMKARCAPRGSDAGSQSGVCTRQKNEDKGA